VRYFKDSSNAFWLSAKGGRSFSSRRNPILILIYGNFQFFNKLIITHFSKFFKSCFIEKFTEFGGKFF